MLIIWINWKKRTVTTKGAPSIFIVRSAHKVFWPTLFCLQQVNFVNKSSTRGAWSLLKQVQSHIGLTITMDPSDESAGSLEDLEWRTWKVYFRKHLYFTFTYIIVLISCYYLMNTRLICVVFVDLARGKGVEQGLRWLGRVVSVLQVQIYRLIPEQAWQK